MCIEEKCTCEHIFKNVSLRVIFEKLTYSVLSWRFNTINAIQKCNDSPHKHKGTGMVDLHALGKKRHSFSIRLMAWKWLQDECW